jgi:hypothetical protein
MKSRYLLIITASIVMTLSLGLILSLPANAETGSVTVSPGYEDGYEEYLGENSDPVYYWRVHYDWTITSGDPSNVRFKITDFYGGDYGGSLGESSGEGYIQVTEGSYYFSWTNNGDSDITVEYDIWYEEASPYDVIDTSTEDDGSISGCGCCAGFIVAGILGLAGTFFVSLKRK